MATTINTKRVFKLNGTSITVSVTLLEVHDYNHENGFTPADDEYKPNWYGIDVSVFYDGIESAVYSQFPKKDLIDRYPADGDTPAYTEQSDLFYEIESDFVPDIERFITDVAYELSGLE